MKQIIDKLIDAAKKERKKIIFLIVLALIGITMGSIFTTMLSQTDKALAQTYIKDFITSINNNKLNYWDSFKSAFMSNVILTLTIWILGISIIGIPVNIFIYFVKTFVIGFSLSAFMLTYNIRGCLLGLIYIFPHHIINIAIYILLLMFSLNFSLKILKSLKSKKQMSLRLTFNRYIVILVFTLIITLLTTLTEVFVTPFIIKKIIFILK